MWAPIKVSATWVASAVLVLFHTSFAMAEDNWQVTADDGFTLTIISQDKGIENWCIATAESPQLIIGSSNAPVDDEQCTIQIQSVGNNSFDCVLDVNDPTVGDMYVSIEASDVAPCDQIQAEAVSPPDLYQYAWNIGFK